MAPLVWKEIERVKDGRRIRVRIQQITQDMAEPVIRFMTEYYLTREPMAVHKGLLSDPISVNDLHELWRTSLQDGAGIVALQINEGEKSFIVGANITCVSKKDEKPTLGKGKIFNKIMRAVIAITNEGNLYERYGVDKYLTAMGLCVRPDYSGLSLGLEILRCREKVCKMLGLTLTGTVFSATVSQIIAHKDNYDTITEHLYREFLVDGELMFKDMPNNISLMAKQYT